MSGEVGALKVIFGTKNHMIIRHAHFVNIK